MLLCAVLACGACHFSLVNPSYYAHAHSTSLGFYSKATDKLREFQISHGNIYLCTITALVLNVFEMVTEQALNTAEARDLIKECGWNAESSGTAAGCFWFGVSRELLNCIIYNVTSAWSPDEWGYELGYPSTVNRMGNVRTGNEWMHAILYILALVMRYIVTTTQSTVPVDSVAGTSWESLARMCAWWRKSIPQQLQPLVNSKKSATSCFPHLW